MSALRRSPLRLTPLDKTAVAPHNGALPNFAAETYRYGKSPLVHGLARRVRWQYGQQDLAYRVYTLCCSKKGHPMRIVLALLLAVSSVCTLMPPADVQASTPEAACPRAYCVFLPRVIGSATAPPSQPASQSWSAQLNAFRTAAGLPPAAENRTFSAEAAKHVRYMLLNPQELQHSENPLAPGYTPEGDRAARQSNLFKGSPTLTVDDAMQMWMDSLPHRFGMLQPQLATTGFAFKCDSSGCAGVLNVLGGLQVNTALPSNVVYPAPDQQGVRTKLISWQFLPFEAPITLRSAVLKDSRGVVATTAIEPNGYFNVAALQPTAPLTANTTYTVEMEVEQAGQLLRKRWSFTTH